MRPYYTTLSPWTPSLAQQHLRDLVLRRLVPGRLMNVARGSNPSVLRREPVQRQVVAQQANQVLLGICDAQPHHYEPLFLGPLGQHPTQFWYSAWGPVTLRLDPEVPQPLNYSFLHVWKEHDQSVPVFTRYTFVTQDFVLLARWGHESPWQHIALSTDFDELQASAFKQAVSVDVVRTDLDVEWCIVPQDWLSQTSAIQVADTEPLGLENWVNKLTLPF